MFFLIAPLLFIGFFSPANSVTVDSNNKKSNEHLISFRDYDFVGEDPRLAALLAERMAVLQAPLEMPEPEPTPVLPEPWPQAPVPFQLKPDYLQSNVGHHVVNVSMDYGELINPSDWLLEVNASSPPAVAPGPGGPPASGYGRVPAPGIGRAPAPSNDALRGRVDGSRRNTFRYRNPNNVAHNQKLLDMMKQCIYAAQRKILELETFMQKYARDPRFRMAFIYERLDEWLHDMRTIVKATTPERWPRRRVKRTIWYYENQLRHNIDITYSIEHMVYLHTQYVKRMNVLMPPKQREELKEMKKLQRKAKKMEALGLTTGKPKKPPNFLFSGSFS